MNKLKKVAMVSAIVCAVSTLAAIICVPFATKSLLKNAAVFYNKIIENPPEMTTIQSLPEGITELDLQRTDYINMEIQKSSDERIHIRTWDDGIEQYVAQVTGVNGKYTVQLSSRRNPINEDTIHRLLYAKIVGNNGYFPVTLYLPDTVSLKVDGEFDPYNINVCYTGFANGAEFAEYIESVRNTGYWISFEQWQSSSKEPASKADSPAPLLDIGGSAFPESGETAVAVP